jgi:hypothetical protein
MRTDHPLQLGHHHGGSGKTPFNLPLEFATRTIAIFGIRGAGKTNTAGVVVEELLDRNLPVVVIDPTDVWWGLRSEYPVFIFGGSHADVPLAETDGKVVAQFIVTENVPIILSLRHLRKNAQRRFVTEFCEELYHLKGNAAHRTALTVFIDEAPLFVPQKVIGEVARTVGAVEDLIARGRSAGFGVGLISQRPATINKDVLTQADAIVTHRITSPQDRKALGEWFEENASSDKQREILASLSQLPSGRAWVWAPVIDVMAEVQIRKRHTFDSSATPKIGEVVTTPKKLTEVNLDTLKSKMGAALQQAKDSDPRELKLRLESVTRAADAAQKTHASIVAKLEAQIQKLETSPMLTPILTDDDRRLLEKVITDAGVMRSQMEVFAHRASTILTAVDTRHNHAVMSLVLRPLVPVDPPLQPGRRASLPVPPQHSDAKVSKAERTILIALSQHGQCSKTKLAALTCYSSSGGGFNNTLSALRVRGAITRYEPTEITEAGISLLGAYDPLPTGEALRQMWLGRLDRAGRLIMEELFRQYPRSMSKIDLAAKCGYEPTGGGFNNALSALRTLELINRGNDIRASEHLF